MRHCTTAKAGVAALHPCKHATNAAGIHGRGSCPSRCSRPPVGIDLPQKPLPPLPGACAASDEIERGPPVLYVPPRADPVARLAVAAAKASVVEREHRQAGISKVGRVPSGGRLRPGVRGVGGGIAPAGSGQGRSLQGIF